MSALFDFGTGSTGDLARGVAFVRKIEDLVAQLGTTWTIELKLPAGARTPPKTLTPRKKGPPKQASVAEVVLWNVTGTRRMPARNMFEINDYARNMLGQRLAQRFTPQVLQGGAETNAGAMMVSLGFAFRDLVIARYQQGGGDLSLPQLSSAYLAYKVRLGYPAKIGTMTGQTLNALRKAQPIARRR